MIEYKSITKVTGQHPNDNPTQEEIQKAIDDLIDTLRKHGEFSTATITITYTGNFNG